jgi:glutamate dehydrogenase/leucine dehydrogenase
MRIHYVDPLEGFDGWLVYDGTKCRLAAGGCRMQPGLTEAELAELASRMTLKQHVLRVGVDGAKCGIDYDPRSAGADKALQRFLRFLRQEFLTRFSMGCDMGTHFDSLERMARAERIPSVKYAIKVAQNFSEEEFFARLRLLDVRIGMLTLAERRAGHALAHVVIAAARAANTGRRVTCALQGFGNLGRAAAYSLTEEGIRITAVADEHGCVADPAGLDVAAMLTLPQGAPVGAPLARRLPSDVLPGLPCDVLILAATQDALSLEQADQVSAPVVVVGANCGLSAEVERRLNHRGVMTIPDFIGGIGGSGSMEAIFGPSVRPSAKEVLDHVAAMMRALVDDLTDHASRTGSSIREVALQRAAQPWSVGERPYGHCPYLPEKKESR